MAAAAVLAGSAITAAVLAGGAGAGGSGAIAATVGPTKISAAAVQKEAAVINAQPVYRSAISAASTMALAAPVDPKAVASAAGDPDDLRISVTPANGSSLTRKYTEQDLEASVLTRLMYVAVLQQILRARHITVTAAQETDGREQARLESGQDSSGHDLFDRLPTWYQEELTQRGADVEALEQALVGPGVVTQTAIQAIYDEQRALDYTTVCLRAAVVPVAQAASAAAMLKPGGTGARNEGCSPMADWASNVAAAVHGVAVGGLSAPVTHGSQVAVLQVTSRTVLSLDQVRGNIEALLGSRYTDLVNSTVENQLALSKVTVSSQYGTYEAFGTTHGVIAPDALTPPNAGSGSLPAQEPRQQPDPFD